MDVAVLHNYFKHLTCLALEQAVIGQHYSGPATGLQCGQNVLQEVELFVAGRYGEIIAIRRLVRAFSTEWWVSKNAVVTVASVGIVDGVSKSDSVLDAVQVQIH